MDTKFKTYTKEIMAIKMLNLVVILALASFSIEGTPLPDAPTSQIQTEKSDEAEILVEVAPLYLKEIHENSTENQLELKKGRQDKDEGNIKSNYNQFQDFVNDKNRR